MERDTLREDMGRTLALGVALWVGAVAAGALAGVFGRFEAEERLALGIFGTIVAVGAYRLDESLGPYVRALPRLAWAAAVLDLAVIVGIVTPYREILIAAVPLAAAGHLALYDRGRGARITSPAAKSPGARPAAT